jgi:hypothetical protein
MSDKQIKMADNPIVSPEEYHEFEESCKQATLSLLILTGQLIENGGSEEALLPDGLANDDTALTSFLIWREGIKEGIRRGQPQTDT